MRQMSPEHWTQAPGFGMQSDKYMQMLRDQWEGSVATNERAGCDQPDQSETRDQGDNYSSWLS